MAQTRLGPSRGGRGGNGGAFLCSVRPRCVALPYLTALALLAPRVTAIAVDDSASAAAGAEHASPQMGADIDALREELRALRIQGEAQKEELRRLGSVVRDLEERMDSCLCAGDSEGEAPRVNRLSEGTSDEPEAEEDTSTSFVVNVDLRDEGWVKEVFFGGKPWVVHCLDKRASVKQDVPDVFVEAAFELRSMATFGTVYCWERLPSGRTLAQRFNLPKPPVTFAVANGDPPLPLDMKGVVRPRQLQRKAGLYLTAQVTEVDGLARFKALCSKRGSCLVVGFQTLKNRVAAISTLLPLLEERRGIRAVALDTTVWRYRIDDRLAASRPVVGSKRADLLCLWKGKGARRGGAFLRSPDVLDSAVVAPFLDRCLEGRDLIGMSEAPWISHRQQRARPEPRPRPRSRPRPAPSSKPRRATAATAGRRQEATREAVENEEEDIVEL
mmetsp:Transcript_76481/g.212431  ORF Transcript_76481/g.212431 Transcript_76481/m.212431 type:complete len:443 (+) Transcript_76481:66-1394(+)